MSEFVFGSSIAVGGGFYFGGLGGIVPGLDYSLNGIDPALAADFPNAYHRSGGTPTTFADLFTHARASTGTYMDSSGNRQTAASGVARVLNHIWNGSAWVPAGYLHEPARTNHFLNSSALSTQGVTTLAQPYTVSFTGTGTITFSGAYTGSLVGVGTGEQNRVSTTFTPTAGTVVCAVSGDVSDAQFEDGSIVTSYVPTAGSTVTRDADTLSIAAAKVPYSPTGLSYAIEGTLSYADLDATGQVIFLNHEVDASNYVRLQLTTGGSRTGTVHGLHRIAGATVQPLLDEDPYTPGQDVDFRAAMRLSDSEVNIAAKDTVDTALAITGLVDVSGADLSLFPTGFTGNISTIRVWGADIGDAGLTEFVS